MTINNYNIIQNRKLARPSSKSRKMFIEHDTKIGCYLYEIFS